MDGSLCRNVDRATSERDIVSSSKLSRTFKYNNGNVQSFLEGASVVSEFLVSEHLVVSNSQLQECEKEEYEKKREKCYFSTTSIRCNR